MARPARVPADLRGRLERTRRGLLALFRALDHLGLAPPRISAATLQALFELDADYAEALWALDQPAGALDVGAMIRDTLASLASLDAVEGKFLAALTAPLRERVAAFRAAIESGLPQQAAYHSIPGRDPTARL